VFSRVPDDAIPDKNYSDDIGNISASGNKKLKIKTNKTSRFRFRCLLRGLRRVFAAVRLLGMWVRILPWAWMSCLL
jgi:hypothetical protein